LSLHSPNEEGYSLDNGIIRKGELIWIGHNSALTTKLISSYHASAMGGHSGAQATYHRLKRMFEWKGMKGEVEDFIKQCSVYQQAKHERQHPVGLLQLFPIPAGAWQDITMDFIEGLPRSDGSNAILVVVDKFTKYAHFIPMEHPFTAHQVTSAVLNHVVKLHGLPNSIVSDRDRIFTTSFWKELFKLLDKKLLMSTSYHPQTDGQSEWVNQCLEMYLRCTVQQSLTKWKNWLPLAELWYNSSSLFIEMLTIQGPLGYEPRLSSFPVLSLSTAQGMPSLLAERDTHVQLIKNNLAVAQTRIMHQADKNRVDRQFQVGDLVLLRLHLMLNPQ
jgi:hypothetical protein